MKKIFLAVLAVAALASCAKEEVISYDKSPIGFGNAFVDNATKAIYAEADDITGFTVFGNVKGNGTGASANTVALYGDTGATVARTKDGNTADLGAAWYCNVVRYWTPLCTFNFAAVANGTATVGSDGLPASISYTVNPTEPADLIYATASATTDGSSNVTATSGSVNNGIVCFTFNHLLSKVTFNVDAAAIAKNDYSVVVKDIAVTGVVNKGTYYIVGTTDPEVAAGTWEKATDATTVSQDYYNPDATNKYVSHLLIPVAHELGVTVTYDILFNGTVISSVTKPGTVTHTF